MKSNSSHSNFLEGISMSDYSRISEKQKRAGKARKTRTQLKKVKTQVNEAKRSHSSRNLFTGFTKQAPTALEPSNNPIDFCIDTNGGNTGQQQFRELSMIRHRI